MHINFPLTMRTFSLFLSYPLSELRKKIPIYVFMMRMAADSQHLDVDFFGVENVEQKRVDGIRLNFPSCLRGKSRKLFFIGCAKNYNLISGNFDGRF